MPGQQLSRGRAASTTNTHPVDKENPDKEGCKDEPQRQQDCKHTPVCADSLHRGELVSVGDVEADIPMWVPNTIDKRGLVYT